MGVGRTGFWPSELSGRELAMDGTMLRVANVGSEADLEAVRDALDEIGAAYEHVDSEPNEDAYPQTAYFQVQSALTEDADNVLAKLSEERGLDAEIL